ncbi:MAG: response regulator [Planctomycetota bacterium]|nr:response regulator [Planctomycetaceae bacterium]MDQ3331931.1 response regulator [Planctomycetota bacterium]
MAKRVLSVGQCVPDQMTITTFLKRQFAAEVQTAETADETMSMLHNGPFDLVLVNRVFDADGGSGLDLIKAIKADPATGKLPVMLISNHADAQQKAIVAGAEPGFGKAQLGGQAVAEALGAFLTE